MIAPTPISAAAYLRRSTNRQEQSLGDQRSEITAWAERNGFVVVKEYVDDAISGTTAKARPGFMQMVEDSKRREFDAIIVWSSDRFSRGDMTETEHYRYVLREAGVTLHSITEDFVSREGLDGDVLRAVKQNLNRQYSVSISQNTLRGQISSVLKESDPGRMPPYGYDREILGPGGAVLYRIQFLEGGDRQMFAPDGRVLGRYAKGQSLDKPGKECTARLVLSKPARVQTVKDIFGWCLEGRGFKAIADELNRRGIMSPKGRLWQHTTIKALIENPTYRGDVVWNRRSESKFYRVKGKRADALRTRVQSGRVEKVDSADWITIPDVVPAIVDRETWDRAQAASATRAHKAGGQGKQANRWLLSGILRCGHCGAAFWGVNKRKGKGYGVKEIITPYYICAGRCRSGKSVCPFSAHVRADALEAWVLEELKGLVLADNVAIDAAVDAFVSAARGADAEADERDQLKAEMRSIDGQVESLLTGLDPANLPLINVHLTQLRKRREYLQQQLRVLESNQANGDEAGLRTFARERLTLLRETLKGRRDEKSRQVLASYIDEIVIEPETKTGYLVVNAGALAMAAVSPQDATEGNVPPTDTPQKPTDRPPLKGGRSQVSVIAGARVDTNLRPGKRTWRRFTWGKASQEHELTRPEITSNTPPNARRLRAHRQEGDVAASRRSRA